MKSILNNPYRVIGLLAGATARERNTKINRLHMYLEAGQETPDDSTFPALGALARTEASVSEAASHLDLDSDRMNAALFWFYSGNDITDEPAFDALADSDVDNAVAIWSKLAAQGEVTPRNCSAFQNLSTLQLCRCLQMKSGAAATFEQALALKLKLLESDCRADFVTKVTDETFRVEKTDLELTLLRTLMHDLESIKSRTITPARMINTLTALNFAAKSIFMKEVAQKLVDEIARKVEAAAAKRKKTPARADSIGSKLANETSDDLTLLKTLAGADDLKYTAAADSIAEEILQCSIDFYNSSAGETNRTETLTNQIKQMLDKAADNDDIMALLAEAKLLLHKLKDPTAGSGGADGNGTNPKDIAERLLLQGQALAVGAAVRKRFEDSRKTLRETGINDENLRQINSVILSKILGCCIDLVNRAQEQLTNAPNSQKLEAISTFGEAIEMAWDAIIGMEHLDVEPDFKKRLEENKSTLAELRDRPKDMLDTLEIERKINSSINKINEVIGGDFDSVNRLLAAAKPPLDELRNVMGQTHEAYLQASTAIASKALGYCIAAVNRAQEEHSNASEYRKKETLAALVKAVDDAWDSMKELEKLDTDHDFKRRLRDNQSSLSGLREPLRQAGERMENERKINDAINDIKEVMGRDFDDGGRVLSAAAHSLGVIRDALGRKHEAYLQASTAIASKALGCCIAAVNRAQENVSNASSYRRDSALRELDSTVTDASNTLDTINGMDISSDFRKRIKENVSALDNLAKQIKKIIWS